MNTRLLAGSRKPFIAWYKFIVQVLTILEISCAIVDSLDRCPVSFGLAPRAVWESNPRALVLDGSTRVGQNLEISCRTRSAENPSRISNGGGRKYCLESNVPFLLDGYPGDRCCATLFERCSLLTGDCACWWCQVLRSGSRCYVRRRGETFINGP